MLSFLCIGLKKDLVVGRGLWVEGLYVIDCWLQVWMSILPKNVVKKHPASYTHQSMTNKPTTDNQRPTTKNNFLETEGFLDAVHLVELLPSKEFYFDFLSLVIE